VPCPAARTTTAIRWSVMPSILAHGSRAGATGPSPWTIRPIAG